MKKSLPFIFALGVLALGFGIYFFFIKAKPQKEQATLVPETTIETPLEDRPYVSLTPGYLGRELNLEITRIKNAKTVEYELTYLSKGLSRGVIGSVDVQDKSSISKKLTLGSCSGKTCVYDEGVEGGTLTLKFRQGAQVRKFTSNFVLNKGLDKIATGDGNFQIEKVSTAKGVSTNFYVVMATIGLPQGKDNALSEPYGVFSDNKNIGSAKVTIFLNKEDAKAKLFSWDGKEWMSEGKNFETDGKAVSAEVTSLRTFVAAGD